MIWIVTICLPVDWQSRTKSNSLGQWMVAATKRVGFLLHVLKARLNDKTKAEQSLESWTARRFGSGKN